MSRAGDILFTIRASTWTSRSGPPETPPAGGRGPSPARSAAATSSTRSEGPDQGPHGPADPRAASRPARPRRRRRPASARTPPPGLSRPAPPRPGELFTAGGQTLRRAGTQQPTRHLGRGPRHRQAPRPDPRGGQRVLGLGRHGGPAPHRHPGRGADRALPPQPGPVPAPVDRRAGPAAVHRPVQDRPGTAPRHRPRARRRPVRDLHRIRGTGGAVPLVAPTTPRAHLEPAHAPAVPAAVGLENRPSPPTAIRGSSPARSPPPASPAPTASR